MRQLKQKIPCQVVALCARMQISLHTSPMLRINCPIPTIPFSPYPYPKFTPQPSVPTHVKYLSWQRLQRHLLMSSTSLTPRSTPASKEREHSNKFSTLVGPECCSPISQWSERKKYKLGNGERRLKRGQHHD